MTPPPGPYIDVNALLNELARRFPAKPFVESIHQGKAITFAEMNGVSSRVARFLGQHGVRANERISILSGNCLEALILFFGILRYGAAASPLNVEESGYNIQQILQDVQPRFVFWHRPALADRPDLVGGGPGAWIPFGDWDAQAPPEGDLFALIQFMPRTSLPGPVGGPDDIALVNFTSGTVSRPKGILVSRAAYFTMVQDVVERFEIGEADRVLEYRAYSWESPQLLSIGTTHHTGATLVLAKHFSQSHFFEWLKTYRITVAAGVPTVINMLLARPVPVRREDLPALRYITCSSAPLAREKEEEFERRYGIPLVQGMGMSEAGFMTGNSPGRRKLGSVGRAMGHTSLRFVDSAGRECGPGEEGEMVVGGRMMAAGYALGRGGMVPIPKDGFPTGDMGYRDADGFIFITGRKKDLIIRGGVNISPMEVAQVLLRHPEVQEAAAVGVPDAIYGEEVVGFVVPKGGARTTAQEVLEHCRGRLPDFKLPKMVLFVEAIPKTDRGKVSKADLLKVWEAASVRTEGRGLRTETAVLGTEG